MTPGARLAAAIGVLDKILDGAPAEKVLTNWARGARYAGSKDRAAVRDHVFACLRNRDGFFDLGGAKSGRGLVLGLLAANSLNAEPLFTGGYAPEPVTHEEKAHVASSKLHWNMPSDAQTHLERSWGTQAPEIAQALCQRAPVDVRVNLAKSDLNQAQKVLSQDGIETEHLTHCSTALRVTSGERRVKTSRAYTSGQIELQDAGSQSVVEQVLVARPMDRGANILDFCAGGGGKSLALAAATDAPVTAHDVNADRMKDIPDRAKRGGAKITICPNSNTLKASTFDLVLCDVPCSGSGAWRRNPDAKWRFSQSDLDALIDVQRGILSDAAAFVRPGGTCAYVTCSLFAAENTEQRDWFGKTFPDFSLVTSKSWTPLQGTDGFFLAVFQRKAD